MPHIIRPDYERVTAFTEYSWKLMPAKPRISGKVAFITGPGAASYAESCGRQPCAAPGRPFAADGQGALSF